MNQFVLIFSVDLENSTKLEHVMMVISRFDEIIEWSCDLDDVDNVLRVVCCGNISKELSSNLKYAGVCASVLAVYKKTKVGGKLIA